MVRIHNNNRSCNLVLNTRSLVSFVESNVEGTREHGLFELGNRGAMSKYFREQRNKNNFRDQKGGKTFKSNLWNKGTQLNI